ncbi:fasciclin domain-containing protein [Pedobacter heparinus]|uniref:fasciclin domain-containing protein n=1 Tax=Pedobacter heparinus TaxID=984 RepID=UPI00292E5B95|nr:fasciclin domain-containing protein [Pedobacter heparinus]
MKQYINCLFQNRWTACSHLIIAAVMLFVFQGCKPEFSDARYDDNDELQIMDYIDNRPDLSTYKEMVDYVKKRSLLKTAGTYTVFVPTNAAFEKLFTRLSSGGSKVSSIKDKSPEFWSNYFGYHLLNAKINTNTFEPGPIVTPTEFNKKFLIADIRDSYNAIKLNNFSTISESNIEMSNGYIDIVDEVLSPPVETIYETLTKTGQYNIMLGIFEETGLTRYLKDSTITLIVERDEVLQRNNFDKNAIANLSNWAAYHIIPDSGYFLNQLTTERMYPVYKKEALTFTVDSKGQYFMNTSFKFDQSLAFGIDRISLNGVYHSIDKVVEIVAAVPAPIRFNLFPPNSNYGVQNVFAQTPAKIVLNNGTQSYHQNKELKIVAFDAQQVGDSFYLTIPEVPAGRYNIRIVHRTGTRGKFITIYNGAIVKDNIDLAKGDGTWPVYNYYIYNNCGLINVESRSDVKLTFALTAFATGKKGDYCCDILMDAIELIPE